MLDDTSIDQIKARFVRAMNGLEGALDDVLDTDETAGISGQIIRHLIRVETGRPSSTGEVDTLARRLVESFLAEEGGER